MVDEVKITPEEANTLYTRFVEDSEAYMKEHDWLADYEEDADKHALTLAIQRERERCAGIAEDYANQTYGFESSGAQSVAEKIRGGTE